MDELSERLKNVEYVSYRFKPYYIGQSKYQYEVRYRKIDREGWYIDLFIWNPKVAHWQYTSKDMKKLTREELFSGLYPIDKICITTKGCNTRLYLKDNIEVY